MIAGSIILIVASAVALVLGWVGADETLIWVSIAASEGRYFASSRCPCSARRVMLASFT